MANQITIEGHVLLSQSSLPVAAIKVELWDSVGTYGLIGSAFTDVDGKFTFIFNDPAASLISNDTVIPLYKTYRDCIAITNTASLVDNNLVVNISENDYDTAVTECASDNQGAYLKISGRVNDKKGAYAPGLNICVYEKGFRAETIVAETKTDFSGSYEVKVSTRALTNSKVLTERYIVIKALDDTTVIATSLDVNANTNTDLVVDLVTDDSYAAPSHFESLMDKISVILGATAFEDFVDEVDFEDAGSQGELSYIARAIGHDVSDLYLLINSFRYADESNTDHQLVHSLARVNGAVNNPITGMNEAGMRDAIARSISDNLIATHTTEEINTFITAAKTYQVTAAKATLIAGETHTLGDVMNSVFGGNSAQATTDSFLAAYNAQEFASIDAFWESYGQGNAANAEKAQRGLRVSSVAGFQPEMVGALMTETTSGIHPLAEWSETDWVEFIDDVSTQANKLCVPVSIVGELTDENEIKTLYAKKLRSIVQNMFPLTAMKVNIQDSETGPLLIEDSDIRGQVTTFISNNPGFDLRISNIYDINEENEALDLTGVTDLEDVQQAMGAFQRVFRIVSGNPAAASAMIAAGHSSAAAITAMPMSSFVSAYSSVLGGSAAASAAYTLASTISTVATSSLVSAYTMGSTTVGSTVLVGWGTTTLSTTGTHADPTLVTLFGNMNYCACDHCLSVYSPAAYLTDIMNFLREGVTNPALYPPIYKELIRRRPDLAHIDMTCKNTNTVMPYIDLVIEILELEVLRKITNSGTPVFRPGSFQTNGTPEELAAHPEHIYKEASSPGGIYTWHYRDYDYYPKVYDPLTSGWATKNLTTEVYPYNLPFSLPAEETRTYLNYLGASRYELMKAFKPYNPTTLSPITDFTIYSELLGLTVGESTIVDGSHAFIIPHLEYFYGLSFSGSIIDPADTSLSISYTVWSSMLAERLDVLIQQLKITYKEFLQFFTTDFLNKPVSGTRPFTISSKDPAVPDTCDLTKLHIVSEDFIILLGKLHRFVRLWRTNIMSVQEWDVLFRALRITTLDTTDLITIGRVIEFTKRVGISVTELTGWWGYIDTHQYVDYGSGSTDKEPSVYDLAYRNRAVINVPLPEFSDLGSYDPWAIPSGHLPPVYEDTTGHFVAQIAAASRIKESDALLILDRIGVVLTSPVTFDILSALYSFAHLAKKTGYTVSELLEIMYLLNIPVLEIASSPTAINTRLDKLDDLITTIETIKTSKITLPEIDYLVRNIGGTGPVAPSPISIQTFYERLRNELQKFPLYDFPLTTGGGGSPAIDWTAIAGDPDLLDALHKLMNVIYQHFSKEFNIPSDYVKLVFRTTGIVLIPDLFIELLSNDFLFDPTYSVLDIVEGNTIPQPTIMTSTFTSAVGMIPDLYQHYRYMYKVAFIVHQFDLNNIEFRYLFLTPTKVGFDFTSLKPSIPSALTINTVPPFDVLFRGLLQLARWIDIRDKLSLIENQLVVLLRSSTDTGGGVAALSVRFANWQDTVNRDAWGTMIHDLIGDPATYTGSTATTTTPVGLLNADFATDYKPDRVISVTRLWGLVKILACCVRTGLKPQTLQKVLLQDLTMADAHQVLLAAKGKHTEKEWGKIAKPLRDTLRRKQRDALVGFVVAHPDTSVSSDLKKWRNDNDLYAFLLIDVEMEACMQTSRIKQAICSVQLYIDRVLLGLECSNYNTSAMISMTGDMIHEWEQWRKWYRIWEANRKVFLYPENWIEPDLRDDKSVFFEEMDAILMQGDITKERAEDAIKDYLRKLETVARLEPIGVCDTQDPETGKFITHAFGRTYSEPHHYFYRRLQNYQWTPWERIEIDIKGEHTLPIVHNGRLYMFWLTFRERNIASTVIEIGNMRSGSLTDSTHHCSWFYNQYGQTNTENIPNEPNPQFVKQIEITLNWTEYKDGKWQEQKVSRHKPQINLNPLIYEWYPKILNGSAFPTGFTMTPPVRSKYAYAANGKSVFDFIVSRFTLSAASIGELVFDILYPHNFFFTTGQDEDARPTQVVWFNGGDPQWHDFDYNNIVAPTGTIISNNRFVQWEAPYTDPGTHAVVKQEALNINTIEKRTLPEYVYVYMWEYAFASWFPGRWRKSTTPILKKSPNGIYKVLGHQNTVMSPLEKGFFYYDTTNTFYARLVEPAAFPSSSSPVSLLSAADDASFWYQLTSQIWWHPQTTYGSDIYMACSALGVYKHYKFYFQNFAHTHVPEFIGKLNAGGVDALLRIQNQTTTNTLNFAAYQPQSIVYNPASDTVHNRVDFDFAGTYSVYNWELFFHIPLLIAKRLSDNQQFADARKWYHYIFDPTSNVDAAGAPTGSRQRFWRFRPFYDLAGTTITTLDDLLLQINAGSLAAVAQVHLWEDNPFKPHLIARMRILAYMKNVVMCYLDNLIAWGDKLYRQNTIESINEATQLYIMASNILGPRPQEIPKRAEVSPRTFTELAAIGLDAFSNALVAIEHYIDPNSGPMPIGGTGGPKVPRMFYYCLPNNPKLLEYWDTVENRLFNIRNCRNISGQVQQLPLFEPPIDPALLVRAAAAGIDASSVLDDLSTPPMPYRFTVMLQKSNELCNDVKALGNALLSALEKKDAEAIALLRSGHELTVLKTMKAMKEAQISEAAANIVALRSSKDVAQARYAYYNSRSFMISKESQHISLMDQAQSHQNTASTLMAVGAFLSIIPEFNLQATFAIGPSFGGRELSALFSGLSTIQSQKAAKKSSEATKTITLAGYERRMDDWRFQADSAQKEMAQIDKQVIAAEIRKAIAEKDLSTLEVQIVNAKEADEFMHSKYTNVELYSWMITQVSTVYFQSYQLAYDVAKRAEKCLVFELPLIKIPGTGFIKFGYWDSLKKGLMSADKLQYDLRKMELAYLEANTRELELTKHFSLALNNPEALLDLRESGMCEIDCAKFLYDLDYPGHYHRRVKSVSLSIPCVAGPYTTIAVTLTQQSGTVYIEDDAGATTAGFNSPSMIATSSAQNDNGVFELNFRDERFLPFEGSGAICKWSLSMMEDKMLRQFDFNTISDVILHVKYSALDSNAKASSTRTDLNHIINGESAGTGTVWDIPAYFSLKHQFANAWFAYGNTFAGGDHSAKMEITLNAGMFPYLAQNKDIAISDLTFQCIFKEGADATLPYAIEVEDAGSTYSPSMLTTIGHISHATIQSLTPTSDITFPGGDATIKLRLIDTTGTGTRVDMNDLLADIYMVATYTLTLP